MKNRDGYEVEVSLIDRVEYADDGSCAITRKSPGWGTFTLTADELNGFEPQVEDVIIVYTQNFSSIRGVVIDGRVLRYITPEQAAVDFEQWKRNRRLRQLELYIAEGDSLKKRAKALPLPLRERMARFADERGVEFWIEDAGYEMYALEGAAALLRKVEELGFVHSSHTNFGVAEGENDDIEGAVQWIEDWWNINSDKHDPPYDYDKQMELVPDFGHGHSGNTAGAAVAFAIAVLNGQPV